jgi:hypothetical protein
MNVLGGKFFTRARFACNEHVAVSLRHFTQIGFDLPHRQARTDQRRWWNELCHGI